MKTTIKNRRDQNMVVYVDIPEGNIKGLAFIQHGLGGFSDQPHIKLMANTSFNNGYIAINFDSTNSLGDSDGKLVDCTMDTHSQDLEDVVVWASEQSWYQEPFVLVGHSMGGMSVLIYATNNPTKIKALAPIATVISYKCSEENNLENNSERWNELKEKGFFKRISVSKPGMVREISWALYESLKKYDIISQVDKINFPVLMLVGECDISTPPEQQQFLFDKLPCEKEIHIIEGGDHDFRDQNILINSSKYSINGLLSYNS